MLNTKLNLYNPDWIELVFAGRNKNYGAFELRQHYGRTMMKAMLIAFTTIVAASVTYTYAVGKTPGRDDRGIVVKLPPIPPPPVKPEKKPDVVVEPAAAAKPQPAAASIKFPPMKVVPNEDAINPPKLDEIAGKEVSSETTEGPHLHTGPQSASPKRLRKGDAETIRPQLTCSSQSIGLSRAAL